MENLPGERAVLVTHPHPLYGGEMNNNVVEAVIDAYGKRGFTTLRFNFRGVGRSEGSHDNGEGEQEDVGAGLALLNSLGKKRIDLAGYSFGAWVNARGVEKFHLAHRLVMVSPPVGFVDFGFLKQSAKIRLVIAGSDDEIAPPRLIETLISGWNPEAVFRVLGGADHFYSGKTGDLKSIIGEFLDREV